MTNCAKKESLAQVLIDTWAAQANNGFLLSDPASAVIETREVLDETTGIQFRFRWMPHREIRGNVYELEKRGILNAHRNESILFRDPRDTKARHCFLCQQNIKECHPLEILVPINLDGREYLAGANFAWIEPNHFTLMTAEHIDQQYSEHALNAAVDFIEQTQGRFRLLFNGEGAGATIPWHFHFQVTTESMPVEQLSKDRIDKYPATIHYFDLSNNSEMVCAHHCIEQWLDSDPENNSINLLLAGVNGQCRLFVSLRDKRKSYAEGKGLVGGFEVAGDFVLSAPEEELTFKNCSAQAARAILSQINPV